MPSQNSSTLIRAIVIHGLVGIAVLLVTFSTVLSHDVNSRSFDHNWVQPTGEPAFVNEVFQDRWNKAIDFWIEHGYFRNGGLWNRAVDLQFVRTAKSKPARLEELTGNATFDPEKSYFYRSNTLVTLIPLALAQAGKTAIFGGATDRRVMVWHNQLLSMLTGTLLGLLATRFARRFGLGWIHALALGICVQVTYQTHPANLASFFRLFFQHLFVLPLVLLTISMVWDKQTRLLRGLRFTSVFVMTLADPIVAVILVTSIAILNAMVDDRVPTIWKHGGGDKTSIFRKQEFGVTVFLPLVLAIGLGGLQIATALTLNPDAYLIGSGASQRSGLNGAGGYGTVWDAFHGLFFDYYLFGPGYKGLGGSPGYWITAIVLIFIVVFAAAWIRSCQRHATATRDAAYATTVLTLAFAPVAIIFSNATATHSFGYAVLLVPAASIAMFGFFPSLIAARAHLRWPVIGITIILAIFCTMSNLRYFSLAFPLGGVKAFDENVHQIDIGPTRA